MEFSPFVITQMGHALLAAVIGSNGSCTFTKVALSSTEVTKQTAPTTSTLTIKQSGAVTKTLAVSADTVQIEAAVNNTGLSADYTVNSIGIYAKNGNNSEVLFAVAYAIVPGVMPKASSGSYGGYFKFIIKVGPNATVNVVVDPAGFATHSDVELLQNEISDVKARAGLTDGNVYGVEVDFPNRVVTRLNEGNIGFDSLPAWGGRYRCNLTDNGVEVAKFGDPAYTETGKLEVDVVLNETTTIPMNTPVQVMVKQPKFYYKVVPLRMEKIEGGHGYHLRKARYYISMFPMSGFKVHPAFVHNGVEKEYIYLSAFEGSLFDVSEDTYILDDAQVANFNEDKLCSIAGAKPISGRTQDLTRRKCGKLAENRGTGWFQSYAATAACTQMLFLVEYASFNTQTKIGSGVTNTTDDGSTNMSEITGATTALGNASGAVTNSNNKNVVSYRGEENFWGNIWKFVDGMNIRAVPAEGEHYLYIADHAFTESKGDGHYRECGFTVAKVNGYVNAFGYSPEFDWLFIPSDVNNGANNAVPVGDYFYQNAASAGWRRAILGGDWYNGTRAGGRYWHVNYGVTGRDRDVGGRSVYVPGVVEEPAA